VDFGAWIKDIILFCGQAGIVVVTLGILVFLHEFGHFIAARLSGVRVLEFSFGMGKILFSRKTRETEYQVRLVPMGGFVKMAGEEALSKPGYRASPGEFFYASPLKRLGIVFSGPFMNLVLSLFAFFMVIFFMGETLTRPIIGFVPEDSPAARAGIQSGDRVVSVNGEPVLSFEAFQEIIASSASQKVAIAVERDNRKLGFEVVPELKTGRNVIGEPYRYGDIGTFAWMRPRVGEVFEDSAAESLGLKRGDLVLEVDGKPVRFWNQMLEIVQKSAGKKISLTWNRSGEILDGEVVPQPKTLSSKEGGKEEVGVIGITLAPEAGMTFHRELGPVVSMKQAFERLGVNTIFTYKVLKMMLLGKVSRDSLMGPVRLAGMVSDFAKHGFFPWLLFLGFISHQLAIINFLPIPALDGGHAVFFLIEMVRGKPVNLKVQDIVNRVGFTLLIGLFFFVVVNDVASMIGG
jgi:regulator of sigma E protease